MYETISAAGVKKKEFKTEEKDFTAVFQGDGQ